MIMQVEEEHYGKSDDGEQKESNHQCQQLSILMSCAIDIWVICQHFPGTNCDAVQRLKHNITNLTEAEEKKGTHTDNKTGKQGILCDFDCEGKEQYLDDDIATPT